MKYIVPIQNYWTVKRGYTFGQKTFYTPHHLGVDLSVGKGTKIVTPCDGLVSNHWGQEGGYQTYLITDTLQFRFLHLSAFGKRGQIKQGELIGLSGNSGLSTGPHLHHDIYDLTKGAFNLNKFENFIDPDLFYKQKQFMKGETSGIVYMIEDGVRHQVNSLVNDEVELVPENVIQSFPEGESYFL